MRLQFFLIITALTINGCASVDTFIKSTGDLTSGRSAESVQQAKRQQTAEVNENAALRGQLASLDAQRSRLRSQLSLSQERLRQVNARLAQENGATQQQRDDYNRLAEKQRDLEARLAAARAEPSAKDPATAAAQKEQVDRMTQEKDILERQINALQRAL